MICFSLSVHLKNALSFTFSLIFILWVEPCSSNISRLYGLWQHELRGGEKKGKRKKIVIIGVI